MNADSPFTKGASILLQRADGQGYLRFVVEKLFEPITISVVLVAQCPELSSQPVVLKIFDPRYFDERRGLIWSPEIEAAAVTSSEPLRWGASRFFPEELDDSDDSSEELDDSSGTVSGRIEPPPRRAERWEMFFQWTMKKQFTTELEAYARLHSLQGSVIPRLLCHGLHVPNDARAYMPPMIVLEHIDGVTVRAAPNSALTTPIINQLYRDLSRFSQYGVLHSDLNWGNFILSPAQSPQRGVIIDFANATLRGKESDEEWELETATENEPAAVLAILKCRRIPWNPALEMEEYKVNPPRPSSKQPS